MLHPIIDEVLDEEDLTGAFLDVGQSRSSLCASPIASLGPKQPVMLSPESSVQEAIESMRAAGRAAVLVVDRSGCLQGIFTERDVLCQIAAAGVDARQARLADHMTSDPEVLSLQDPIAFVLNRMTVGGYRHVPIVDAQHRPCGIVSVQDVIAYIVDARPCEVYNLRPDPLDKGFDTPEGA